MVHRREGPEEEHFPYMSARHTVDRVEMYLAAGKRGGGWGVHSSAPFLTLAICYANFGTATLLKSRQQCEGRVVEGRDACRGDSKFAILGVLTWQRRGKSAWNRTRGIADTYVDISWTCF